MVLINIAIITCQNYNCSDSVAVIKEQTRDLKVKDLSHVNYDPEKTEKNVILEHDKDLDRYSTFRAYVKDYYDKEEIAGRFNIDTISKRATTTLSSFVVSGSRDFIESFKDRGELVDYFKSSLEFLKTEYPTFHCVDARIHLDEKGLPHMHASFLPIMEREDHTRAFNVSKAQPGKNYFRGFQDRYFSYMKERYPEKELQRTDPKRDHEKKLSVKEYKEFKELQRDFREKAEKTQNRIDRLKDLEKQVENREEELLKYNTYFSKIEEYCNREGLTPLQYEKDLFYADRGYKEYPEPEKYNPDREQALEQERQEPQREHERSR